ncbi:unnamed protein product [Effrenium voratum]|uniref:TET-Associated Glycosyltransferase domain-containing protein n=1 Tax=Effrenium voratum TaxID=2562239 RepID=A0AA36MQR1_9DINO|nr:unnamed protein product [Effrenium voratum]CAJ1455949.1 unnamed protein product [Effrenium voratum]
MDSEHGRSHQDMNQEKKGAKGPQVTLLSVGAIYPGRSFPNWKVAFSNARSLRDVVRCWANAYMGVDLSQEVPEGAQALADGKPLNLERTVGSLRETLSVRQGAYSFEISWPAETLPDAPTAAAPKKSGASKLRRLHPSARYCHVDRRVMGWGSSTTHKAKIAAGTYADTIGHFPEAELAAQMRTPPPLPKDGEVALQGCLLAAIGDDNKALFHARLIGPQNEVLNWEATCRRCERVSLARKTDKQAPQVPYPVFIPTCGRPEKAHLNWQAAHVFGCQQETALGLQPVVCMVVEPEEEERYRAFWPSSLMLILPESNRGPGYARWVVQRVCTRSYVVGDSNCGDRHEDNLRRLYRIWIADDTLTMFYRLALMDKYVGCGRLQRPKRMKHRVASKGQMFLEALLAIQRHPFSTRAAVAGFLRDDGTAVCKRNDWKLDEMALYKIVLLDLPELWRLGIEYMPQLRMYEDICLNHDVLSKGGRTLKCQCYGFRAVHAKKGGCLEQRHGRHKSGQTRLKDLVKKSEFGSVAKDRQKAVRELLQWVRDKEVLFQKRTTQEKPAMDTPNSADRKEQPSEELPREQSSLGAGPFEAFEVSSAESEDEVVRSLHSSPEDLEMITHAHNKPISWGSQKG